MSQFLVGKQLSDAIKELLAGRNVRCAVAFWGKGAVSTLFGDRRSASGSRRVICDISMGCTSPSELAELGAPANPYLKYIPGLHAKVYISDLGIIVGSANASSNGIGWWVPAKLLEAGTFHHAGSPVWKEACDWFDRCHEKAQMVDEIALGDAGKLWELRPLQPPARVSLLTLVRAKPGQLGNIGFVFASNLNSPADIEAAKDAATEQVRPEAKSQITSWHPDYMFCDWEKTDVRKWPWRFISFWKSSAESRLWISAHVRHFQIYDGERGDVFSDALPWKTFARGIGTGQLLSKEKSELSDAALAQRVIDMFRGPDGEGKVFPTAIALAQALEQLV